MRHVPVLIAGGGPVGMTLARTLASLGVRCMLVERNASTTRHPKMDITNGRSMELFRRLGLADKLRAVGVPEANNFDISWITSLTGRELHRFRYPSVVEKRAEIRARNDGTQPREPAMRVSQVMIEPVLQQAVLGDPLVEARWGVAFEAFTQDEAGVTATLRNVETGETETVRCDFLAGCDGGSSIVRDQLGIACEGKAAVTQRYMIHFRSDARDILQAFGVAWHYQTDKGTLIAQDDKDTWTLQTRPPAGVDPAAIDPDPILDAWVGRPFARQILVANPWVTHLLLAERYHSGRVFLAGDFGAPIYPDRRLRHEHRHRRRGRPRLEARRDAQGFAGGGLLESYARERRPVGYRNRLASERHTGVRIRIAEALPDRTRPRCRCGARHRGPGRRRERELGHRVRLPLRRRRGRSGRLCSTTAPGARLPSTFLRDGSALYDRLGPWFTLLRFGDADPSPLIDAAPVPLETVIVDDASLAPIYEAKLVLVRPDTHVAWRGDHCDDGEAVWRSVLG